MAENLTAWPVTAIIYVIQTYPYCCQMLMLMYAYISINFVGKRTLIFNI